MNTRHLPLDDARVILMRNRDRFASRSPLAIWAGPREPSRDYISQLDDEAADLGLHLELRQLDHGDWQILAGLNDTAPPTPWTLQFQQAQEPIVERQFGNLNDASYALDDLFAACPPSKSCVGYILYEGRVTSQRSRSRQDLGPCDSALIR